MRRLALSLVALCGLTLLAACSGGTDLSGSNSSSTSIGRITFTNGSAQADDFFVSPTGNAPIEINGIAYETQFSNLIVPNVQFTWSAVYAPAGTPYPRGPAPNGNGTCGTPAATTAIESLLTQVASKVNQPAPTGQPYGYPNPFYPGYVQLTDANNPVGTTPNYATNLPNYTQTASTIFVGPPLTLNTVASLGPVGIDTDTPVAPSAGPPASTNYCLLVTAAARGVSGTVIVVVTNSP